MSTTHPFRPLQPTEPICLGELQPSSEFRFITWIRISAHPDNTGPRKPSDWLTDDAVLYMSAKGTTVPIFLMMNARAMPDGSLEVSFLPRNERPDPIIEHLFRVSRYGLEIGPEVGFALWLHNAYLTNSCVITVA